MDGNALPAAAPGSVNGQQRARPAGRQRFVPYVADDRYRSLNRTGPITYELAIERQLRRSRKLIEETRQRTQDRQINQEAMIFDPQTLKYASPIPPRTSHHSPRFDKILYYAAYVLHFDLSEVQISYMEELMKVLYQYDSPVSHHEVESIFKNTLESYNIKISYFCSSCTDLMEATQNFCQNAMCSIYRQNFNPPNKIQEYAIRVNNAGGMDEKLKDLPPEIEDLLIGFAEDALGYGHEELVSGFEGDLESSSFYESLGNNEEERRRELSQMRHDRSIWRPHLYHGLQKALGDVRASKYKENDNSWFPSNRQKKKSVAEVPENNIETTSDRQKRRALAEAPEDNIEIIDDYAYLITRV